MGDSVSYLSLLSSYGALFMKGAVMTLYTLSAAGCISIVCGFWLGLALCEQLSFPVISRIVQAMTFALRAVPFYVQLLIVYFVLPDALNISLDALPASILALGVCSSGYTAKLVAGSLRAVPREQWEVAAVLGYSKWRTIWHIVRPQMMRTLLPALCNEMESILKSTAILSSIGLIELTRVGQNIIARTMDPMPVYLTMAAIYCLLSYGINLCCIALEGRWDYAKAR